MYPAAQFPWALPLLSAHSVVVKQVPLRFPEPLRNTYMYAKYNIRGMFIFYEKKSINCSTVYYTVGGNKNY